MSMQRGLAAVLICAGSAFVSPANATYLCGAIARHEPTGTTYKAEASGLQEKVVSELATTRALQACAAANPGGDCGAVTNSTTCSKQRPPRPDGERRQERPVRPPERKGPWMKIAGGDIASAASLPSGERGALGVSVGGRRS